MTLFDILKIILEVSAILLGCYLIYREKDLIKIEKKIWKYSKAFVKACAFTLRDKIYGTRMSKPTPITVNRDYEELLKSVSKESNIIDIRIAS